MDAQYFCYFIQANYKSLLGYTKKVWILTKVMKSNNHYEYCIWQKKCYSQYRNRDRQKFNILSDAFNKSKNYGSNNYTYYFAYKR